MIDAATLFLGAWGIGALGFGFLLLATRGER